MALHSPSPLYQWTFGRVVWATLVLTAVGLSFWLLYHFHQVFFILFVAAVLGTILRPVVAWLHQWRIPPKGGGMLVYLLLLALLWQVSPGCPLCLAFAGPGRRLPDFGEPSDQLPRRFWYDSSGFRPQGAASICLGGHQSHGVAAATISDQQYGTAHATDGQSGTDAVGVIWGYNESPNRVK